MIKGTAHVFGINLDMPENYGINDNITCQLAAFTTVGGMINFLPDYFLARPLLKRRDRKFTDTFDLNSNIKTYQASNVIHIRLSNFAFKWIDNSSGQLEFIPEHIQQVRGLKELEIDVKRNGISLCEEISIVFSVTTNDTNLIQACEEIDAQMLLRNQ